MYDEKSRFIWGPEQSKASNAIKTALTNAVAGANPDLQIYLVVDASFRVTGRVLLQMEEGQELKLLQNLGRTSKSIYPTYRMQRLDT